MTRDDFQKAAARDDRRAQLMQEYEKFKAEHALNLGSADEHIFDQELKPDQRVWLQGFCARWDQNEKSE